MNLHVCPRDWTHTQDPFIPTHLLSLQNPNAQVDDLRPPWIAPENHHNIYGADELLHRHGTLLPLTTWNKCIPWHRTFR